MKIVKGSRKALPLPEAWKSKQFPKTLGECIDKYGDVRTSRLDLDHKAEAAKAEEEALRLHLIQEYDVKDLQGAKGHKWSASISQPAFYQVKDPMKFFAYVAKTKQFDLLHKACAVEAAEARFKELGMKGVPPGVERGTKKKLNLSKIKSKK